MITLLLAAVWPALLPAVPARAAAGFEQSNRRATFACVRYDPQVLFSRRPNCSGWASRDGIRSWMSYNALGLRDKDYPPKPARGVLRVLFTGGSMISAPGLAEKDDPARVFEAELRRRGLRAEVINASGEGYVGWENVVRLPRYLAAYSPQVVIYHLEPHYLFSDRALWLDLWFRDGKIAGRMGALRFLPSPLRALLKDRHRLIFYLHNYIEQWDRIRASWQLAAIRDPGAKLDDLLKPTVAELAQMRDASRAAGARFYVVYDGDEANADEFLRVRNTYWAARLAQHVWVRQFHLPGSAVVDRLRGAGFRVLSLAAVDAQLTAPENCLPGDYHWNERGARIFGAATAERFARDWRSRRPAPAGPAKRLDGKGFAGHSSRKPS
ncbi:MAG: hypothetical protein KGM24_07070 [Elusimicrobia bacterium]|nr:hypothetical protein [Elusimicrobiota bacterium]